MRARRRVPQRRLLTIATTLRLNERSAPPPTRLRKATLDHAPSTIPIRHRPGHAVDRRRGALIVAGSCSIATQAQNKWIAERGHVVIEIDPVYLLTNGATSEVDVAVQALLQGRTVLIKTQSAPTDIARVTAWGRKQGLDAETLGVKIASDLAQSIEGIIQTHLPKVLVIAGGETSTAICRALRVRALAVGRNIEPGVPLCVPLEGLQLPIVLKSGNFGSPEFYDIAIKAADDLR